MHSEEAAPAEPQLSGTIGLHEGYRNLIKKKTDGKTNTVSVTLREEEQCSLSALIDDFQEQMPKNTRHLYNIKHQYKALCTLK